MPWVELGREHLMHVLERSQENLAMYFATVKTDQFNDVDHKLAAIGLTQIDHCVAYYECETVCVHIGGAHNILVAKVINLKNHPEREHLILAHSKVVGLDFTETKTN